MSDGNDQTCGCEAAFRAFDPWAGRQLGRAEASALLPEVAAHLDRCPECAADFAALLDRLRAISVGRGAG